MLCSASAEKYDPPANVTVAHNGSHRVLRWENPQVRFDIGAHMLCYELDIRTAVSSARGQPGLRGLSLPRAGGSSRFTP